MILPALLEQSHTRTWLKGLVRSWCKVVAWLLNLHSYLLGDGDGQQMPDEQQGQGQRNNGEGGMAAAAAAAALPQGDGGGLGAAHQAFLLREGPTGERKSIFFFVYKQFYIFMLYFNLVFTVFFHLNSSYNFYFYYFSVFLFFILLYNIFSLCSYTIGYQPYERPSFFYARLAALVVIICISLVLSSLVALTLPVWLGRRVMALWLVGAPPPGGPQIAATSTQAEVKVHELYTAACGMYLCWLAARAVALLLSWLPQVRKKIK